MRRFPPWLACLRSEEQILLSSLPADTVTYNGSAHNILPDSLNQMTALENLNVSAMNPLWTSAQVDALLIDASNAILSNANYFSKSAIVLNIGGGNGAPSGTFRAPSGDGGVAVSGLEAIWALVHNVSHRWTVSYSGGEALAFLFGPTESQTAVAYGNGNVFAQKYTVPYSGNVCEFWVSVNGSCNAIIGLYSDVGGVPTSLLCSTASTACSNGVNRIALATPYSLSVGDYWLAWQISTTNRLYYCSSPGASYVYKSKTYGAFDATFPVGYSNGANIKSQILSYGLKLS